MYLKIKDAFEAKYDMQGIKYHEVKTQSFQFRDVHGTKSRS